jgi:TPR repeat protein
LHFRHYGFGGKLSRLTMQSAKQGYVKAQYLLGLLYEGGKYVPEDHPSTNERVFGPIAQKIPDNFEPSPGSLFMMGDGIPPNYQKAIEWYLLAAKQGHETAKLRLKNLDDSINIDQDTSSWLEEVPPWDEYEIPPWIQGGINTDVEASFKEYGITSIWHMTHKDNINEILTSGILRAN